MCQGFARGHRCVCHSNLLVSRVVRLGLTCRDPGSITGVVCQRCGFSWSDMCHPRLTLYSFFSLQWRQGSKVRMNSINDLHNLRASVHDLSARFVGQVDTFYRCDTIKSIPHPRLRTFKSVLSKFWCVCPKKKQDSLSSCGVRGRKTELKDRPALQLFLVLARGGSSDLHISRERGLTKKETFSGMTSYLHYIKLPRTVWDLLVLLSYKHFV